MKIGKILLLVALIGGAGFFVMNGGAMATDELKILVWFFGGIAIVGYGAVGIQKG